MKQVARNLTDVSDGFLSNSRFLIMDRDTKYTDEFRAYLKREGVTPVLCPVRVPNCNALAERFVRSIKSECLDRMILFGEHSLRNSNESNLFHISLGYDIDQDRECVMNVRPLHDRVIVRRKEEEHLSTGGIAIPDTATEKPVQGEVVEVGNGRLLKGGNVVPLDAKPGGQVLFGKYAGTEIKLDDEESLVMREADIMAVLEE